MFNFANLCADGSTGWALGELSLIFRLGLFEANLVLGSNAGNANSRIGMILPFPKSQKKKYIYIYI